MVFGARASGKFESVYYNLQFWLFLGHFFTSLGLVIFFSEIFLGVSTLLIKLRGSLAQFALSRKGCNTLTCSFLMKLKLPWKKPKAIHIFIPNHMTPFRWPTMSLGGIKWRSELGPRETLKACINLQFWLFWAHFWISPGVVIFFLLKHY